MNTLRNALNIHGANAVFNFIVSSFPYLGQKLKQAKSLGHDIQSILNQFEGLDPKKLKEMDKKAQYDSNPLISGQKNTLANSAKTKAPEYAKKIGVGLTLGALATGAGAYALSRALPANLAGSVAAPTAGPTSPQGPPGTITIPTTAQIIPPGSPSPAETLHPHLLHLLRPLPPHLLFLLNSISQLLLLINLLLLPPPLLHLLVLQESFQPHKMFFGKRYKRAISNLVIQK